MIEKPGGSGNLKTNINVAEPAYARRKKPFFFDDART